MQDKKMQVIYKYCDCDTALKILKGPSILFNNPLHFNDPFDSLMDIDLSNRNKQDWENYFQKHGIPKSLWDELYKQVELGELKQTERNFKKQITTIRVSCFSENNDNILLWSHYSKYHTGVCLGFKVYNEYESNCLHFNSEDLSGFDDYSLLAKGILPLLKVEYSNDKPYPFNPITDNPERVMEFIRKKSRSWEYENEYRIPIYRKHINLPDQRAVRLESHMEIDSIIFGVNNDHKDMEKIIQTINQFPDNGNWIKLYRADKNRMKYKIDITEYHF
ncbi:MAG: DUF2971 domain-containing protein [bacterium]|jgi:hypothetical protein